MWLEEDNGTEAQTVGNESALSLLSPLVGSQVTLKLEIHIEFLKPLLQ